MLGLAAVAVWRARSGGGETPENDHFHEEEHDTIVECGLTLQRDRGVQGTSFNPHVPDGLGYAG